jgi:hypothetical protein
VRPQGAAEEPLTRRAAVEVEPCSRARSEDINDRHWLGVVCRE